MCSTLEKENKIYINTEKEKGKKTMALRKISFNIWIPQPKKHGTNHFLLQIV